ncbi:MAG: LysR family transcriptional regulator [Sulfobacillus sp.]
MMEIRQLRALAALTDTGSFTQAAELLHMTQSALSQQIKSLEDECGLLLVVRSKPRARLTSAGEEVMRYAKEILQNVDQIERISHGAPRLSGTLRISTTSSGITYLYGDLCREFMEKIPEISVVLQANDTPTRGLQDVKAGQADLAFVPWPLSLELLDGQFLTLGTTEHVMIVGSSHPLAGKNRVLLDELRSYPFALFERDSGTRFVSDQLFQHAGGYPPIYLVSNDTEFIMSVVALGKCTAMVPCHAFTKEKHQRLHILQLRDQVFFQEFGVVYKHRPIQWEVQEFIRFCQTRAPIEYRCFSS